MKESMFEKDPVNLMGMSCASDHDFCFQSPAQTPQKDLFCGQKRTYNEMKQESSPDSKNSVNYLEDMTYNGEASY